MERLIGNEAVRRRLFRAADEQRMHHCYLFEGPEGVGKATMALQLALYVNCESAERPCGACHTCRTMTAGTHPDLLMIGCDPEKTAKIISADQARSVISALQLQRHSARRRFILLDPADALTEDSGNALLKTLEEPPDGTQFVLVTARAASLLQTVRSRSQRVRFGPVPEADLRQWLLARKMDPELAAASQGSPGLAMRLAAGEASERLEVAEALVGAVGRPLHQLFAFTEAAGKRSDGAVERSTLVIDALEELVRDVVFVASGRPQGVLHGAHLPRLQTWAAAMYPGGVGRIERAIAVARDRMRLNVNGRVVLEALLTAVNLELSRAG